VNVSTAVVVPALAELVSHASAVVIVLLDWSSVQEGIFADDPKEESAPTTRLQSVFATVAVTEVDPNAGAPTVTDDPPRMSQASPVMVLELELDIVIVIEVVEAAVAVQTSVVLSTLPPACVTSVTTSV
jgi:hypothetical protein